jgi:hypothetical protein
MAVTVSVRRRSVRFAAEAGSTGCHEQQKAFAGATAVENSAAET